MNANKKDTFSKNWLSDPSCYPLIAVMGAAGCLVVGVISSCLLFSPDVQIAQKKRGAVVRTWVSHAHSLEEKYRIYRCVSNH